MESEKLEQKNFSERVVQIIDFIDGLHQRIHDRSKRCLESGMPFDWVDNWRNCIAPVCDYVDFLIEDFDGGGTDGNFITLGELKDLLIEELRNTKASEDKESYLDGLVQEMREKLILIKNESR